MVVGNTILSYVDTVAVDRDDDSPPLLWRLPSETAVSVTFWGVPDPPMLLTIPEAVVTSSSSSVTDSSPKSSSGTPDDDDEEGSMAAGALVSTIVFRVVMTKSKPEFNSKKQRFHSSEINLYINL